MSLADPISRLAYRYDAVIVGSGYGGAILAARLAEAGASVCVLERGREWLPREFPTDEAAVAKVVRSRLNPLGLIDANVQLANDLDVVVGSGLGGTSLINAAIALRPEPLVFEQAEWPAAIRQAHRDGSLARHYARAEEMLGTRRHEPLAELAKVRAHATAVGTRSVSFSTLPLNITRTASERWGVAQPACTHCGDCVAGCNVGAKNTLATNYLPFAKQHGARLFTGAEVLRVAREASGGYRLDVVVHRGAFEGTAATVRGDVVVLSAGSLGSTEILLRSQDDGLRFSPRLGDRFSANADILGFAYNGTNRTEAVGFGLAESERRVGSTITSYGDYRRGDDALEERFLLLEGAVPAALAKTAARGVGTWALTRTASMTATQRERTLRDLVPFATPGPDGALFHSNLFLACGHDSGNGRLVLKDPAGRVAVSWPGVDDERVFELITREMEALARAHGALFVPNPRSTILGGERQMTVHPLGGCPMGDDVGRGVVDDRGRVFRADGGLHEGLFVADGAIIPRSLGVTPLLTISALSERIADALVRSLRGGPP